MKVNKKYHKLVNLYSFNPISECSLFKHIVIQHFYKNNDKNERVKDMEYYIYWYNDKEAEKQPQVNEIFKYSIRQENNKGKKMRHSVEVGNEYIDDNIDMLEEWSGLEVGEVLYDSERDGKESKTFRDQILHHKQMYFIIIDSDGNVFGHYHSTVINSPGNWSNDSERVHDRNIFMFTLNSNGRCEAKKCKSKINNICTVINPDDTFFCVGDNIGWNELTRFDTHGSYLYRLPERFIGMGGKDCTKEDCSTGSSYFTAKRLIVIEMN